jgi:hypothetical protein
MLRFLQPRIPHVANKAAILTCDHAEDFHHQCTDDIEADMGFGLGDGLRVYETPSASDPDDFLLGTH